MNYLFVGKVLDDDVKWRGILFGVVYVMIEDGVIRLYLGIWVKDDYDYKFRLWWVIIN